MQWHDVAAGSPGGGGGGMSLGPGAGGGVGGGMVAAHSPTSYDNNNEANATKAKLQQAAAAAGGPRRRGTPGRRGARACRPLRLNGLWSVWYGFLGTALQLYIALKCTRRFLRYSTLSWPSAAAVWELHACLLATGLALLVVPLFFVAAVFKVGNRANDGAKLGRGAPADGGGSGEACPGAGGNCRALWRHGGPTAAFLHLAIAFGFLVPKLVMEARLVEAGFLPADALWHTDLDFMVVHRDRLVVLSFMTAAAAPGPVTAANVSAAAAGAGEAVTAAALVVNATLAGGGAAGGGAGLAAGLLHALHRYLDPGDAGPDAGIESGFGSSVSVEYANYALAWAVYAVRYPAVFWATNKWFAAVFSAQLAAAGARALAAAAGVAVLYKVQVVGARRALPLLPATATSPFLLDAPVTLALHALADLVALASSLALYLYGHGRYHAFLAAHRLHRHHHVSSGGGSGGGGAGYAAHCAALAALLAGAVTQAPLLHDLAVAYRGALDGAVLAALAADIAHLLLWLLLWLGLTAKQRWTFAATLTVARATVRSARSLCLVTDVHLAVRPPPATQPLVVVGAGRAYAVAEPGPRNAIMSVVHQVHADRRHGAKAAAAAAAANTPAPAHSTTTSTTSGGSECVEDAGSGADGDEQIYWLRPAPASPQRSPDSDGGRGGLCWWGARRPRPRGPQPAPGSSAASPLLGGPGAAHQVAFDAAATSTSHLRGVSCRAKVRSGAGGAGGGGAGPGGGGHAAEDVDDGDYATLRELPLAGSRRVSAAPPGPELDLEDSASEEGKLLARVLDERVTYASTGARDLAPPADYEDPSPLLTPEPLEAGGPGGAGDGEVAHTPRCLRRTDSGVPAEELTPRSDSAGSGSPPAAAPASLHSETSSGVHSTASSARRATSVADLAVGAVGAGAEWRGGSLQRNVAPPTAAVAGVPAVLLEGPGDTTLVIRRAAAAPLAPALVLGAALPEEPFGRSTNMRMTSFADPLQPPPPRAAAAASAATLPHYPTQPGAAPRPHCSTMPLPPGHHAPPPAAAAHAAAAASACHLPPPRAHTTLPTHHNGVRLFPAPGHGPQHPYLKRLQHNGIYGHTAAPMGHTAPAHRHNGATPPPDLYRHYNNSSSSSS